MKKKQNVILTILFSLTAIILVMPIVQEHYQLFKFKPLAGYQDPTKKPNFTINNYISGIYQQKTEKYIEENFGFREPLIRMFNQCIYDLFKTTNNHDVAIEKDGWLYHTDAISQYFGHMDKKFDNSNDQVRKNLAVEARSLAKINAILKEYDVKMLTFSLPTKSYVYPEHLRKHPVGDTSLFANSYYEQLLSEKSVPHINMTTWFQRMQDTIDFDLFYSKGSHWASGATIAMDSILRYMEQLGGKPLSKIQRGTPYSISNIPKDDIDLENLLNLARPLKHEPIFEYPVKLQSDENTVFPTVWFVGTSFYWYIKRRVNLDYLFQSRDFTFYRALYYTERENVSVPMDEVDYMRELLLHDYVVFFRDGPQLHANGFCFPGRALIGLCISEQRLKEKTDQITDSIMQAQRPTSPRDSLNCRLQATFQLEQNPELFEELRGDAVPTCRNPKIKQTLVEKSIRDNRSWRFLLNAKACNDSTSVRKLFEIESNNVLYHKPLLRDKAFFTTYDYFDFLMKEAFPDILRSLDSPYNDLEIERLAIDEIGARLQQHEFDDDTLMMMACAMDALVKNLSIEETMSNIREKAQKRNISIDKMFREDAVWCFNNLRDLKRFMNDETLNRAFEFYKIEYNMRHNKQSMDLIQQKHIEDQMPFRVIMSHNVEWIYNNR